MRTSAIRQTIKNIAPIATKFLTLSAYGFWELLAERKEGGAKRDPTLKKSQR